MCRTLLPHPECRTLSYRYSQGRLQKAFCSFRKVRLSVFRFLPVFMSLPSFTVSPASALPLNPCSGANSATGFLPSEHKVSSRWVLPVSDVWFATKAIFLLPMIDVRVSIWSAPFWIFVALHMPEKEINSKITRYFMIGR